MITQQQNRVSITPVRVKLSDDKVNWIEANLVCVESDTDWPFIADDGNHYRYIRSIKT